MSGLFDCATTAWSPTIGDPSFMGWFTVFAYLLAAILSGAVAHRRPETARYFWLMLTLLLVFLTVNKQLDLQSALTAIGRCSAQMHGWYDQRGAVQLLFIAVVATVCVSVGLLSAWGLRRDMGQVWLALFGVVFLLAFVAIRTAGFHHIDRLIGFEVANVRLNWVLELGGITMITVNAVVLLFKEHHKDDPPS